MYLKCDVFISEDEHMTFLTTSVPTCHDWCRRPNPFDTVKVRLHYNYNSSDISPGELHQEFSKCTTVKINGVTYNIESLNMVDLDSCVDYDFACDLTINLPKVSHDTGDHIEIEICSGDLHIKYCYEYIELN